jgi:cephalosporin hydroxylase
VTPDGIARSVAAWQDMRPLGWRGHPCQQFPSDMLRYAELICELRPPWVLECGTADGGAALFLADMMDSVRGHVISIDSDPRPVGVTHPRLTLLKGDAADPAVMWRVAAIPAVKNRRGLVLLDDDHSAAHVLAELDLWARHADYLVVQDTLMGYLPQYPDNPLVAVEKWLPEHREFEQDGDRIPTNHPGGWLRRVSNCDGWRK